MDQQRTDGVVRKRIAMAALGAGMLSVVACSSTPAPRPLPEPRSQQGSQSASQRATPLAERPTAAEPERADASTPQSQSAPIPTQLEPARSAAETVPPTWFRDGAFEIDGREHRAFAVTAGDVRAARGRAMALAYERYPQGHVAAHEAVRQADGSWRFFLLMAAGG